MWFLREAICKDAVLPLLSTFTVEATARCSTWNHIREKSVTRESFQRDIVSLLRAFRDMCENEEATQTKRKKYKKWKRNYRVWTGVAWNRVAMHSLAFGDQISSAIFILCKAPYRACAELGVSLPVRARRYFTASDLIFKSQKEFKC